MPEKFNATITHTYLSLVAERMAAKDYHSAEDFLQRNPDLLAKDLLRPWYSAARLDSDVARAVPLMPDQ